MNVIHKVVIEHPLTGKEAPIYQVLHDLAAQENCDGDPYDQMVQAAEAIKILLEQAVAQDVKEERLIIALKSQHQPHMDYIPKLDCTVTELLKEIEEPTFDLERVAKIRAIREATGCNYLEAVAQLEQS